MGGTRIVSSAADVPWMRGVGRVCEMCMARGGVGREGDEWMRGLGLCFTNPVGTGGVWDVCLCCGGVGGEGLGPESGGVVLCMRVRILCVAGRSRYLYIVLGGYLCIFGAPSVQSCYTLWISASYRVFVYGRYCKSRLVCWIWICLDITLFHEEQQR